MKLLFQYTLDYLKRNRRGSFAIMLAILITSTMLSALCGFMYNMYMDTRNSILLRDGDWHGELFDSTKGSDLSVIESFDSIESIMIKGNWKTAKIEDPRRDYLVWRDATTEYWNSIPEGSIAILEGRIPAKTGEIALSKQYFEHHPELKIGDTITLPLGNRISKDKTIISPPEILQSGESFEQTSTVSLTVVSKLDVATSSTTPAYTAIGYLDPTVILPEDDLTVYLRFKNIHDTYKELPKIAAAIGYEPDEYGNYLLKYNTSYLTYLAVLSPQQANTLNRLLANSQILMFGIIGLLVVGVFVLIIHNSFALSSSARLSQLGIFASVGATPKQIKRSIVLEALLLTAIPLPLGLLLGQFCIGILIDFINKNGMPAYNSMEVIFLIGWPSLLPAVLLTLLTVWWSALIPAKRIARMSPIAAIRQGGAEKLKKPKRLSLGKLFGLTGELAGNALQARKRSYRTATISLTLSFLTLACFLCINSATTASNTIYQTDEKQWADQDILLTLYNVATPEDFSYISKEINDISSIHSTSWFNYLSTAVWLPNEEFSSEFLESGGFKAAEKKLNAALLPLLRDGQRRVDITLIGLDNATFSAYCKTLDIDPAPFYENGHWRSILYHTVEDVTNSTKRNPILIPFLNASQGDTLKLTEATTDSYEGDFTFGMEIAAVADKLPPLGSAAFGDNYSAVQFMPMDQIKQLASHFARSNTVRVNGVLQVTEPTQIAQTRTKIEQICESYYGSGDYRLYDENEYAAVKAASDQTFSIFFGFVTGLLAVIGLSNVWSTVRGTLNARRREFAMLRSVGLPPIGLRKMLLLESLMLGLKPILLSLPIVIILQIIFLFINEVSFLEWLPFMPLLPIILYITAILAVTAAAYTVSGYKLLRENIIEAIKMDTI